MNCLNKDFNVRIKNIYIKKLGKTKKSFNIIKHKILNQDVVQLIECEIIGKVIFCEDFILSGGDHYLEIIIDKKFVKTFKK